MKNFKIIGLLTAAVIAGGALYWSYRDGQIHPSTDDAYLQANILTISPQIFGRVAEVAATENSFVEKGTVLFKIDAAPLSAALETAQANFSLCLFVSYTIIFYPYLPDHQKRVKCP